MPLLAKEMLTRARIHEWQYYSGFGIETGVVSFSGGKDSTVLLHMCRKLYPNIPAVFSNTGLEYPEIQSFVKKHDNVKIVRPKMQFSEVISTYGYPLIGKEVAGAIYYARRIRPSAERERGAERASHSDEWCGKPSYCADGQDALRHTHTQRDASEPSYAGNGVQTEGTAWTAKTQSRGDWNTYEPRKRDRWALSGFRSAAGVEPFKSQFNKEKYLPLARDIPVPISHYCCQVMKKSPLKAFQKQSGLHPSSQQWQTKVASERKRGCGRVATPLTGQVPSHNPCHSGRNKMCCNTSSRTI